jgi:hypothetical protein
MTLTADEFMRRFLLHVLPGAFTASVTSGLIANNGRQREDAHCGAAMLITQTILRGQAIRAPPPLQERR